MKRRYLDKWLIYTMSTLILGSGMIIAWGSARRYSHSLRVSAVRHGRNLVNAIRFSVHEKAESHDLQSLKKLLKENVDANPSAAYALISLNGEIMVHTFSANLPLDIQHANYLKHNQSISSVRVESESGETYLDIAMPLLRDREGMLRVGFLEKTLMQANAEFWLGSWLMSLFVLSLALLLGFILIRKTMRPLRQLVWEAAKADQNGLIFDCPQCRHEETRLLASLFAKMTNQLKASSQGLEACTMELDRSHRQFLSSFEIVRTVGSHETLNDLCAYLAGKLKEIMVCPQQVLITTSKDRNIHFTYTEGRLDTLPGEKIEALWELISGLDSLTFIKKCSTGVPMLDGMFQTSQRVGIIPIQFENQNLGALIVGCPKDCQCYSQGLEIIHLVLQECSGAIKRALNHAQDLQGIQCQINRKLQFCGIVGKDRQMQTVYKLISDIAPTDATVLVQGESGTGKELVAKAIHDQSPRKDKPFIVINCSAYPTSLLESELFGHEKGAFTGAIRKKIGRFEQAESGTVFLDEIGEIAPSAQIKLLRVLQTQTFERIGGEQTIKVNVRIIAATNKDLIAEVQKGLFREDLYYRLNVIPIYLPPLRKRQNDIPLLARHFMNRFRSEQKVPVRDFRTETMRKLLEYTWPGNVRELENTIEHAIVLTKEAYIEVAALPSHLRTVDEKAKSSASYSTIVQNEKRLFQEVLEETEWNKKLAAERLGISRSTLYNKIKKYKLSQPTIH